MRRQTPFAFFAALAVVFALLPEAASAARRDAWALLGERAVSDAADHDLIPVTAARGDFRKLQVRVLDRGVEFRSVKLHFANGEVQEVELRRVIPAGGASRVIDIVGGDRVIRSVELRYDAQSLAGKSARVRVFARR